MSGKQWEFWIDRGGTFTDIIAKDPDGQLHTHKLLSEVREANQDAVLMGIRHFLQLPAKAPIPADRIASVKLGTTVATNALLERKGAKVALVTNQGFADALQIGYQHRSELFALEVKTAAPLYQTVIEIPGRLDAKGQEIEALEESITLEHLQALKQQGIEALAIVLMHSYLNPEHEKQVAHWAEAVGFTEIATSSKTSGLIKFIARGRTTVVDAYLNPVLQRYIQQVRAELPGVDLQLMQSHGGLCQADHFRGKDAILSGPAGGMIGAIHCARLAGIEKIIGFDMGGTSTDVCHYAGELQRTLESELAGVELRVPMLDIHTVAAGGGSIIQSQLDALAVGPHSAGANPGPLAYRLNGPLTLTDANLLLGRIQAAHFPAVFGESGQQPLDKAAVERAFSDLARTLKLTAEALAEGALQIANETMAQAVQTISTQRGYDLRDHTLVSFGGAGGQHACFVAEKLGIQQILLHPYAGVLSAYGIGLAQQSAMETRTYQQALEALPSLDPELYQQRRRVKKALRAQGLEPAAYRTTLHLNYLGSDTTLDLDWQETLRPVHYTQMFEAEHLRQFGFIHDHQPIHIHSITVEALGPASQAQTLTPHCSQPAEPLEQTQTFCDGVWHKTAVYAREHLAVEQILNGPALILENTGTVYLPPNWQATQCAEGHLLLELDPSRKTHKNHNLRQVDSVLLGLYHQRFMSLAKQMGAVLAKTAHSVNIKERLDFSCALFDDQGNLIANAPHVPVHLGSMGEAVKTLIKRHGKTLQEGDSYALNNPFAGGTHLPDITVISPVFVEGILRFYVASRGHHADIGGITPGSMPAESRLLEQEGVILDCLKVVEQGKLLHKSLQQALTQAPYPVRNFNQNLHDLQAQLAANQAGILGLQALCQQADVQEVCAYMEFSLQHAEQSLQALLPQLHEGRFRYLTDQGTQVTVKITLDADKLGATFNFTGTSPQQTTNFNAPLAITRAATLYVLRTLVQQAIPLNDGFLRPIKLIVPEGCLLNPKYPAAVVAGNVETSQVITDTLYGALQVQAASQGTMNNLTFGDEQFQYYETLCGGTGAGPHYHGASAVHSHMTNSRLTDPEILEQRYPVRLKRFAIRRHSGGRGRFHGGDGCERHIEFLAPMTVSVLSNRRKAAPYGMAGGEPGKLGQHGRKRKGARTVQWLNSTFCQRFSVGDELWMHTPGGGGYGKADNQSAG
ncbi:MAG: hydantoinase B/oxoprolinase family protein [Thiotrichales bacterium]|nr:hydantoinase B/oxoprolinase family protein [Thiotrichales bacterium]